MTSSIHNRSHEKPEAYGKEGSSELGIPPGHLSKILKEYLLESQLRLEATYQQISRQLLDTAKKTACYTRIPP